MDVSTSSPLPDPSAKHQLTRAEALLGMRAAEKACQRKQAEYTELCNQAGLKFLPGTFESPGKVHSLLETLFTTTGIMRSSQASTREYHHITSLY